MKIWQRHILRITINQGTTSVTKWRNYCTKLSKKCRIKAPKRALGSSLHFLTELGRWEWIILAIWIAYFILFLFCNEPVKKFYGVLTLTAKPPVPFPSVRTLWMTPSWNYTWYNVNHFVNESINSLLKEVIKAQPTVLYGLSILLIIHLNENLKNYQLITALEWW